MDLIQSYGFLLVVMAAVVGFVMAWGIGANDVANAMGTSVGSKAITLKQAIIIAMIFEFAGAYLAGGEVTSTIRKGIIDVSYFTNIPEYLVLGMIASLLAAGIWLAVASYFGWPVSTTHSIIGAIVGFTAIGVSPDAVEWSKVGGIVGSWVVTPAISGMIAILIFLSAKKLIFDRATPLIYAVKYVPIYMGMAGFIMSLVTIKKGLKHVGLGLPTEQGYLLAIAIGVLVGIIGMVLIRRLHVETSSTQEEQSASVEKIFAILMVLTACCMAFAHGSNDVANAIGPLAAVVSVVSNDGLILDNSPLAWWILPLGGVGIVAGLALFGHRVMKTIGQGITHLTPSKGFAAELAAATTVLIASGTGLPISTTQTLVGAVLGVGIVQGVAALNMKIIRTIVVSWVVTLPAGATLSIIFFFILKFAFGV
ncbi:MULTISPECIES: inorganic phosphate transporter [Alteromonadaceae]|jgi:PiT family inorganic phosphate transporter|uniref:Phosphate transporter n=1 Tax=Brumicola blandensis TaxID=3075611 RepID=A0AAW8R597_9ALTE|nr:MULTISPECIES: inorganic phosphate transporter [unclassified Alteromonas]MDT0583238.1 anion permease [Alteromonas sp. W409]MDT0627544.1 anion permease [Alteromonas sp. W364]